MAIACPESPLVSVLLPVHLWFHVFAPEFLALRVFPDVGDPAALLFVIGAASGWEAPCACGWGEGRAY